MQSIAVKTVGARLSVVKQSLFGLPGQYGRRVTKANSGASAREARQPSTMDKKNW